MPANDDTLKVGYVLERFPCASETFIANEVRGVTECGASVTVFALAAGAGGPDVRADVVYARPEGNGVEGGWLAGAMGVLSDPFRLGGNSPRQLIAALRHGGAVRRFAAEVERRGIRHLHAHFASLPTTLALMVARLAPVTVSFSAHAWDIYVGDGKLPQKLSRARLCIACTEANADRLRALAREGDRDKVVRIYHGTDLARFSYRPRPDVASPPRIVAVGRMVPKKGFETLLHACAALKERRDFRCELFGEGPLADRLKALARRLGLEGAVTFPGWVPYGSMADVYHRADLVAVPSVQAPDGDRDGLPNVVVEAMAAGTPVVGSDFSGIPEAVKHEGTGLLCPPGDARALADAVERMLTDAPLREHVVEQGRRLVERSFDCAANARNVYEALRRAAGE